MTAVLPSWQTSALCRTELDPEAWFSDNPVLVGMAKAVCGRCPVSARCGAEAIDRGEEWGVFGGLSREDRLTLGMVIPDAWHGTPAGVKAHGCDCGPCRTAHARDVAAWRSRRRWAATDRGVLVPIRTLDRPKGRGLHRAFPNQLFLDLGVAA